MDVDLALAVAGWFVQVIFDKLLTHELLRWASRVGLGPAVDSLSSELQFIKPVLDSARRAEIGSNEPLRELVAKLRDLARDAENLLDEIDYFRLKDLVEGTPSAASRANESLLVAMGIIKRAVRMPVPPLKRKSSCLSLQDVAAQEPGSSSALRMKLDRADMSRKIQDIVKQLQTTGEQLRKALLLEQIVHGPAQRANPRETSSFFSPLLKVFGRDQDKNDIVGLLEGAASSDRTLSVFAIVGHGGFGKTTLAQQVYKDPRIEGCFDLRIWVHVSASFDEVRLIHEILQHVPSADKHADITNLNKLQEILRDGLKSKKFLLILDDMWEDREKSQWDRLVAPLTIGQVKGSAILVTTRKPSVAGMINATNSIELDGLVESEFWSLFKACAFGNERHEGHQNLQDIGRQIAKKLKGCPLAAKCIGAVLNKNLGHGHWMEILDNNTWKFLQGTNNIMQVLRLSYDYLPFHLQRCFSYCALFPKGFKFNREELVRVWMAQGLLHSKDDIMREEDIGSEYLNELTDWGFFQRDAEHLNELVDFVFFQRDDAEHNFLSMHDLIYDLAQIVSSDECLIIDDSEPRKISQTVHHISIITSFAYFEDEYGRILRNENFEQQLFKVKKLQMKNLSTLMLFGEYDSSFAKAFQNVFREANNVRILRLSTMNYNVDYLLCNFGKLIHLRYLYLVSNRCRIKLSEALCKLYHLQVLSWINPSDLPRDFCNLISLRHFITNAREHSMIAQVGKLTALQELKNFTVKKEKGFDIKQLRELRLLGGSLCIHGLGNLRTKEEASWAKLTEKKRLKRLLLSWEDGGSEARRTEEEVLEGLEPHSDLKHLSITGYNGVKSPAWLDSRLSLTLLESLRLADCEGWRALPPLGHLPFLKKLSLTGMCFVREVQILSLEEMRLCRLPKLEKLLGMEQHQMSSHLRVLDIYDCPKLTELPQYSDGAKEQWFPHLCSLDISDCPQLMHLPPLPHTQILSKICIKRVGSLPHLSLQQGKLFISNDAHLESLSQNLLVYSNLSGLQELHFMKCQALTSVSWQHLRELVSLKTLQIHNCGKLCMPPIMLEKEQDDGKCHLLPSLQRLIITNCNVTGMELSWLLQHLPPLSELSLAKCLQITSLVLSVSVNKADSSAISDCLQTKPAVASIVQDGEASIMQDDRGRLCLPYLLLRSLLVFKVSDFPNLVSPGTIGFQDLVSLNKLCLTECPMLLSSMLHSAQADDDSCLLPQSLECLEVDHVTDKMSRLVSNMSSLTGLFVHGSPCLTSLWLHPCKALRELRIEDCPMLSSVDGLHSLVSLKELEVYRCPYFTAAWCRELQQQVQIVGSQELSLPIESLQIDDTSFLTTSICKLLSSLESLTLRQDEKVVKWTEEQELALLLLPSLRTLEFVGCPNLLSLPAELYRLLSLKELCITECEGIRSLPKKGLPTSLLQLHVAGCSKELSEQCEKIKRTSGF